MFEIDRKTGDVRTDLTQDQKDALWRKIVENMAPQVLKKEVTST